MCCVPTFQPDNLGCTFHVRLTKTYRGKDFDFAKISILTNVNPKPTTGVKFTSIGFGEDHLIAG